MAYDPNDPKDKEIVQGLIDAALEDARTEHEAEVDRLSNKNTELLGKLRKARTEGGADSTVEIERLERELDESRHGLSEAQSKLRTAERELKRTAEERDAAVKERDTERSLSHNELMENKLTAALVDANVAPHFMDAAKALLKGKAAVEMDGDNRLVKADGKDVGEFVKEWAASDAGKHYVSAPGNAGGGATGPNGNGTPNGGKKLADLSEAERLDMARNRPEEWKAMTAAAGQTDNPNVIN
jgi:hypothetical protein